MGIHPELYIQEAKNGKDLPVAAITMFRKEKKELCEILAQYKISLRIRFQLCQACQHKRTEAEFLHDDGCQACQVGWGQDSRQEVYESRMKNV